MERQQAENRFNSQPINCPVCKIDQPNYLFLLLNNRSIVCYSCLNNSRPTIASIKTSLKEHIYEIIRKLPIPDYKVARACLQSLVKLRTNANELISEIKNKIKTFEIELDNFLTQTEVICSSYIQKVQQIEQSHIEQWLHNPPKLIDQQRFIINIKQKHHVASLIANSLKDLQILIPSIDQIKKSAATSTRIQISKNNSITASINARGNLYLGANDGQLFYEHNFKFQTLKAHQSLIRAFQHDGQFRLFSGSDDYTIKMWDIKNQPVLQKTFGNIEGVKSYHRQLSLLQGRYLASSRGQFDGYKIRLWDLSTFTNTKTLDGHDGYIRSMIVDCNGCIVTVSEDRYLKVWQIKNTEPIRQYFHSGKILFIFALNQEQNQSYCILDDKNRIILLDQYTLLVFQALNIGRKITYAGAGNFIYVHIDRYVMIYNWQLGLEQKIDLGSIWTSTNLIEMGASLFITDAHGYLHQYHPNTLVKN